MEENLWGDSFTVVEKVKIPKVKKISTPLSKEDKDKTMKRALKSKALSLNEKLDLITNEVNRILGKHANNTVIIHTVKELVDYIDQAIKIGTLAVDTETNNSLDPITCKIMGGCLYSPGLKQCYVPINHVDPDTNERLSDQITEKEFGEQMQRVNAANIFTMYHNGKFDYEVIKCTCGVKVKISWDSMIAAKMLDENEKSAGLKQQYIDKIDPDQEAYKIDSLFKNIDYAYVKPAVFALYSATDAYMTYKLGMWQKAKLELPENAAVYNLFKTIEMPLVPVLGEMELNGMDVDQEYGVLLSKKYHTILNSIDAKINESLKEIQPKIDSWKLSIDANKKGADGKKSKLEKLSDPISLTSPTQLAILFYDILKLDSVNDNKPRGTGADELNALYKKSKLELFKLLIDRREIVKLLTTYIDIIPELAKRWPDGRVRTHFNQYGASTGRLSSSDPINFQNIPAHNKEIRMLFRSSSGYRIIGSDYSSQEPRTAAHYSQDQSMIDAYNSGKDLYAVIAQNVYKNKYEDNLEFYPAGTKLQIEGKTVICGNKTNINKQGKERRTNCKSILLGILYGRGAASVAEQIGKTKEEAQEIIDKFYNGFPKVKAWIDKTQEDACKVGYVEDFAGRRRHLPDLLLPKYNIGLKETVSDNVMFNPFLNCEDKKDDKTSALITKYNKLLDNIRSRRDFNDIQSRASAEGLSIKDNTGFISQAERQAVNSRVQGGAATLTKVALINLYNDPILKDLGAFLINTVHDEILMEVPEKNSVEAAKRLAQVMIDSAKKYLPEIPMKCDTYNTPVWYLDEFFTVVQNEFKTMIAEGDTEEKAFDKMVETRTESTVSQLHEIIDEICPSMKNYHL